MSEAVWVLKCDYRGQVVWRWPARILWRWSTGVALEGRFAQPRVEVGGLVLQRGDRMVEFFYTDRWYNLFAVYAADGGGLRGWYANIGRPARWVDAGTLAYDDLALDLVVLPDGRQVVLDAEEFTALPIAPAERVQALRALAALQRRFRRWWPQPAP